MSKNSKQLENIQTEEDSKTIKQIKNNNKDNNKDNNKFKQISLKNFIKNSNSNDISVDVDSDIVRNSELDPEANSYAPIQNTNEEENKQNNNQWIEESVKFEIDYHFSDVSLSMDNYLLSRMHEDKEYWVPFDIVANLTKVKAITSDLNIIRSAIKKSTKILFNQNETKVKRPNFVPPKPKQHKDLRRTVFLYGLKGNISKNEINGLCKGYGTVKKIVLDNPNETKILLLDNEKSEELINKQKPKEVGLDKRNSILLDTEPPDREVAEIVMKKKFGPKYVPLNLNSSSSNENNIIGTPTFAPTLHIDTGNNNLSNVPITPNIGISQSFLHPITNPNGDPNDFSHLRSCFVVFESQGQATKCVKDRLRSSDGIRAMHQYDFNKAKKKVAAAKARGLSPMFSPLLTTIPTGLNSNNSQNAFNFNSPMMGGVNSVILPPTYWSNNNFNNNNNNNNNFQNNNNKNNNFHNNRRSYNNNNRYSQSTRNVHDNRRNTHSGNRYHHNKSHSARNINFNSRNSNNNSNSNNNNNSHIRRASEGSRWEFTNKRTKNNMGNNSTPTNRSPHHTPKKTFINSKQNNSDFEGITAKGPGKYKKTYFNSKSSNQNKKGFGWTRNNPQKQLGTIPPQVSPNNYTFNTGNHEYSNNISNKSPYYRYQKSSNTPNSLTATIDTSSKNKPPRTTTSINN